VTSLYGRGFHIEDDFIPIPQDVSEFNCSVAKKKKGCDRLPLIE
jgi:hypothetical protein